MSLSRRVHRLAVLPVLVALLVVAAGPAGAVTGSVQVGPTATRVAAGAAIDVPLTITLVCDEGFDTGAVNVFVAQKRGTSLLTGTAQATFPCTGETQTVVVRVVGGPFHGGPAVVNATLLQCRFDPEFGDVVCFFTDISTSEEVLVRGA
jgi:hypothetical protein